MQLQSHICKCLCVTDKTCEVISQNLYIFSFDLNFLCVCHIMANHCWFMLYAYVHQSNFKLELLEIKDSSSILSEIFCCLIDCLLVACYYLFISPQKKKHLISCILNVSCVLTWSKDVSNSVAKLRSSSNDYYFYRTLDRLNKLVDCQFI